MKTLSRFQWCGSERSVKVKLLRATLYADDGWTWRTEEVRHPTWGDIEAAVRRLDRFHYPFIWLYRNAEVEEDTLPEYNVMGGEGEFAMDFYADGNYLRYYNAARGDDEIAIWRSDQGARMEAKYCCASLEAVLGATRYFCVHGVVDAKLTWNSLP